MANAVEGPLSSTLLKFMARYGAIVEAAKDKSEAHPELVDPSSVFILGHAYLASSSAIPREKLLAAAAAIAVDGSARSSAAATLTLLLVYRQTKAPQLIVRIFSSLLERTLMRSREEGRMTLLIDAEANDFAGRWLGKHVTKVFPKEGELKAMMLEGDFARLEESCVAEFAGTNALSTTGHGYGEFYNGSPTRVSVEAQKVYDAVKKSVGGNYSSFLYARTTNFHITEVRKAKLPLTPTGRRPTGK